jgi:hypothetical protein
MATRLVVLDDLDGKVLEDADPDKPTEVLSVGGKRYKLFLSEANHKKLQKALEPFLANAEEDVLGQLQERATRASSSRSTTQRDPSQVKAAREYLQSINWQYNGKPLSDRGRIPQEGWDLYEKNN